MNQPVVKSDKFLNETWLTSKEAKALLKVSDCHLMHMRLSGELPFRKEGNRFMYMIPKSLRQDN